MRPPASAITLSSLPPQGRLIVTADPTINDDSRDDSSVLAFWSSLRRIASDWLHVLMWSPRPSNTFTAEAPRAGVPPSPRVSISVPPSNSFGRTRFRPLTLELSWNTAEPVTEWERIYQRGWDAAVVITAFGLLVGLTSTSFSLRRRLLSYMRA